MDRFDELIQAARGAWRNAYAPYSHFRVGASVQSEDGRLFVGANVENASFGLSICAERVAIFSAISAGAHNIEALALSTERAPQKAEESMPCGACRQVMAEFMSSDGLIIIDQIGDFRLSELLAHAFVLTRR